MPLFRRSAAAAAPRHAALWMLAAAGLVWHPAAEARWKSSTSAVAISGSPSTSDTAGQPYSFTPSVSGGRTWRLRFRIANKPVWASFDTYKGTLSGTPTAANVGKYANIGVSVSDGYTTASLPAFSISVTSTTSTSSTGTSPTSLPPTISGSPPTTVLAGSTYTFQPTASSSSGSALSFSIQSKPAWAAFSIATGQLSGTPTSTQVGTYGGIVISVSDGTSSAALPSFSIAVTAPASPPPASTGSATLTWVPPTLNSNGSALTNLAGYEIDYGTASSNLSSAIQVSSPGVSTYTITGLPSGTWYFGVRAITSLGTQSPLSNISSKTIP